MYITDSLVEFLHNSMILSDSTIILTDLTKVIFVASNEDNIYLDKKLHTDLKKLLDLYSIDQCYIDYMNVSMDTIIPIIKDDDVLRYKSQIVLPIVINGIVERFAHFCY